VPATNRRRDGARLAHIGRMALQRRAAIEDVDSAATNSPSPTPGKNTQIEQIAAEGVRGAGEPLPFADRIAESFGAEHADTVRGIHAHTGEAATAASEDIGARAYATGDQVAFAGAPDLHTAAHEAAHVVQQRQGVSLKGGVGEAGDPYEQHADAVADRVVSGLSAASLLGADPGTAGPSSAVQRRPSGDWGPDGPGGPKKPETAASFEPVVGTDPLDEERTVVLGETIKQGYHVSNARRAPAGTKYEWSQHVEGRKTDQPELTSIDKHHGTVETSTFRARAYGTRTIKTSVTSTTSKGQRTGDADDVKVDVPRPKVAAVGLDSLSARWGTRPVIGQMNFGDDLQVTVKYDQLATKPGEAELDLESSQFTLKQPAKQDPKEPGLLRAVVTPKTTGPVSGRLMLHALEHRSVDPAAFQVDVHEPSDENDSGPQPVKAGQHSLADNAIEQALEAWGALTEQRRAAVHQVMIESQKVDPPKPAPWWHALLKAAVEIALAATTGGIASGIATLVEQKFLEEIAKKALKEGVKEFAKTFVEESLNKSIEATGVLKEHEKKEDGGGEGGKGLPSLFLGVEMAALGVSVAQEANYHRNHLRNQVDVLEAKEQNAGVRYAMALQQSLMQKASTTEAEQKQYAESFQAYNNLLARMELHSTAKDENDVRQDVKAGTNLSSLVFSGAEDLKQEVVTKTHMESDGLARVPVTEVVSSRGGGGPKKVPGVLRLELEATKHGTVKIKKAQLPGITSKSFAETVHESTLGKLQMNVIGIIDQRNKGAVIGRNEKGEYSAHEKETSVLEEIARAWEIDARDPAAVAKLIFETQLSEERVKPEIG
jgi:hypothetical protein